MNQEYKINVFVYKKRDRGEADRIFTCFSDKFGKIDIFAKSIRKIDSKLKSGIDIFYFSEIEFIQGKKKILTDVVLINKFSDIINNIDKFLIAKKICKVLDVFVIGQEHDKEIFDLIISTFENLNNFKVDSLQNNFNDKLQLLYLSFVWNFFAILGYSPQTENCAICYNKLNEKGLYFSNKEGGVICKNCHMAIILNLKSYNRGFVVSCDVIKILRIVLKNKLDILLKLKINKETIKEFNKITKDYYLYLLHNLSYKINYKK